MSFDLCMEKKAEHPFFIESIGIRIYTIEELCWFLHNNLYLIDRNVTSAALAAWIRDELGLKSLARKLMDAVERPDKDASYFIVPIFQETRERRYALTIWSAAGAAQQRSQLTGRSWIRRRKETWELHFTRLSGTIWGAPMRSSSGSVTRLTHFWPDGNWSRPGN